MKITFSTPKRGWLRRTISEALKQLRFESGHLLAVPLIPLSETIEKSLTKTEREFLERAIGERPLLVSIYCFIVEEVNSEVEAGAIKDLMLTELALYRDPETAADRIISMLESLPLQYRGSLMLPESMVDSFREQGWNNVRSERINLVGSWEQDADQFPAVKRATSFSGALDFAFMRTQEEGGETLGLHITVDGYATEVLPTRPIETAVSMVKSLFGLFIAVGVCRTMQFPGIRAYAPWMDIYRAEEIRARLRGEVLDVSDANLLNRLFFTKPTEARLEKMKQIIDLVSRTTEPDPLVLAGRWLFESYANRDEAMAFMQAAIVLEVLLGEESEKEGAGLTSLLANRCAYMIAGSRDERQEILKAFRSIYDTRSRIVHAGKASLTMDQKTQYFELQKLCDRVVRAELAALRGEGARRAQALAEALRETD
ncbi:hypothetical protein J2789_004475 [Variovorax paradoxus]|uniref:HEPN domain-containing protein n=1 Tax=Variovorax atrisoli TaxID=3394203 RepID=UPI00119B19C9|nr:HEPN domain-containing protein [Variovorax paradoxus]MDR6521785.1 hypothetical protein [Variovorax paradoxus]